VYIELTTGLARTIYIRCIYGIFDREMTKYTVIYGVHTRFWPNLHVYDPAFTLYTYSCTYAIPILNTGLASQQEAQKVAAAGHGCPSWKCWRSLEDQRQAQEAYASFMDTCFACAAI
jgi:hypothetical protein